MTVLIIDDDSFYLDAYAYKFEIEGFGVVLARDGEEGLEAARRASPSVILLDIIMPDMSGLDVLKKLKEDPKTKDIPVVIASIVGDKAEIERGLTLGAEHYITKEGMTPDQVVEEVRKRCR